MAYGIPCPRCQRLIEEEARFCSYCGIPIQHAPRQYYYQPYMPYVPDVQLYYNLYQVVQFYWNQLPPWAQYIILADLYRRGVNAAYNRLKEWFKF
jgi:predicted amidophosphoribosyltransferase